MFPVTYSFISLIITNWYSPLHFSTAEVMNIVFMETPHSCQNSFCNTQNMPFWHHNATVGTSWLTNIWLVKSHRYNQTCPNVQLPVRMLTAVVRKCGPWQQKLQHSAGDDGVIKTACSFGVNCCDFFWTLSLLSAVKLVVSYILTSTH